MVVSQKKNLFTTSWMLLAGLSLSACATLPEASTPMRLGQAAAPPSAFLDFCQRQPQDCAAEAPELIQTAAAEELARRQTAQAKLASAERVVATASVSRQSVAWGYAFEEARRRREAAALQDRAGEKRSTPDWSAVFAARLRPTLDVEGKTNASLHTQAALTDGDPSSAQRDAVQVAPLVVRAATPPPELTPKLWATVSRINSKVNQAITQQKDIDTYGVEEFWATPLDQGSRFGDCEDYVLEKRKALIAEGVPEHALSIAVVRTSWGETHAVLLLATDQGDYVLDNLNPWVLPWAKANLTWLERQVDGSAFRWARVRTGIVFAKL